MVTKSAAPKLAPSKPGVAKPAAKPAAKIAAKPIALKTAPAAKVATGEASETTARNVLKKKDFVERVTLASGLKKADARTAIDVVLAAIAEALAKGEELVLPPLGKIKTTREKVSSAGRTLMLKLTMSSPESDKSAALAQSEQEG